MRSVTTLSSTHISKEAVRGLIGEEGSIYWFPEKVLTAEAAFAFEVDEKSMFFNIFLGIDVTDEYDDEEKAEIAALIATKFDKPVFNVINFRNYPSLCVALRLFPDDAFVQDDYGTWYRVDEAKRIFQDMA